MLKIRYTKAVLSVLKIIPSLTFLLISCVSSICLAGNPIDDIVNEFQKLEEKRDPKCYATASRLEDFMFGTPLSFDARFRKNLLQKDWAKIIWNEASLVASNNNESSVTKNTLKTILNKNLNYSQDANQHWTIHFSAGHEIRINGQDKRQYSAIAYALRAILAVQQESLMDLDSNLLPLKPDAIQLLKDSLDLLSLSVLKVTDAKARKNNLRQVDANSIKQVWRTLTLLNDDKNNHTPEKTRNIVSENDIKKKVDLSLIRKIIQQKVNSYRAYNQISNELFVRNLQVYYARLSWPKDKSEGKRIRNLFTETLIQFAYDLYKESEKIALSNNHKMILESDVHQMVQVFIPHQINDYEDAIFFPKLPRFFSFPRRCA